jgi:hypothetical protein
MDLRSGADPCLAVFAPTTVRSTPIPQPGRSRVVRGAHWRARSIEPTGTFLSDHFGRQTRPTAT